MGGIYQRGHQYSRSAAESLLLTLPAGLLLVGKLGLVGVGPLPIFVTEDASGAVGTIRDRKKTSAECPAEQVVEGLALVNKSAPGETHGCQPCRLEEGGDDLPGRDHELPAWLGRSAAGTPRSPVYISIAASIKGSLSMGAVSDADGDSIGVGGGATSGEVRAASWPLPDGSPLLYDR